MTQAIRIHEFGGPQVLRYERVDIAEPASGQVLVEHRAIGVNMVDRYVFSLQ